MIRAKYRRKTIIFYKRSIIIYNTDNFFKEVDNMPASTITKRAISAGFKELMRHKSFDRITIADITDKCGLNRQTFYYHFQDKYELINWIYYNDYIADLSDNVTLENWNDKILELLTKMKKEAYFFENAFKSSGYNEFEKYLLMFTNELFIDIIQKLDKNNEISKNDMEFNAQFYSFGSVGMIVSWAKTGMTSSPENIVIHIKNLVYDMRMLAFNISQKDSYKEL